MAASSSEAELSSTRPTPSLPPAESRTRGCGRCRREVVSRAASRWVHRAAGQSSPERIRREAARLLAAATDLLVAAQPANLAAADTARTVVVASTSPVPTGQMVTEVSGPRPDVDELCSALDRSSARATFFDARSLALRLLGDDQFANILQLGAAYQEGAIPLEAASIEQAIRLNGVGVERNLSAFCLGRLVVDDPQTVSPAAPVAQEQRPLQGDAASLRATIDAGEDTPLARRLDALVADLVAYQDLAYAREFVEFVEHVRRVEGRAGPLTAAVAGNLYKLMAYKDEYEVAQLSVDGDAVSASGGSV
nr:DUF6537 domain-containing protein [Salinispora tropica]